MTEDILYLLFILYNVVSVFLQIREAIITRRQLKRLNKVLAQAAINQNLLLERMVLHEKLMNQAFKEDVFPDGWFTDHLQTKLKKDPRQR